MTSHRREFNIHSDSRDKTPKVRNTENNEGRDWEPGRDALTGSSNMTPLSIRGLLERSEEKIIVEKRNTRLNDYIKHHLKEDSLNAEDILSLRVRVNKDDSVKKLNIHRKDIMQALASSCKLYG